MRYLLVLPLLLLLAAAPVRAEDWRTYENARFGYEIALPPGFAPEGPAPANGDGRVFATADGSQVLRVYGGHLTDSFPGAAAMAIAAAEDAGWDLSYKRTTQRWTSYSGTRDGMILYARGIALCDGTQFASFELEYPLEDLDAMHRTVERLVATLKASGSGC